jgi:4-hydroxybenzoate polyprenyltransferase
MTGWRDLLLVSRPITWVVTALPFLVAAFDVQHGLTPAIVLGTIYFLGPYNLLRYGLDDIGRHDPEWGRRTRLTIAIANLPPLILLVWLAGAAAGLGLAIAVAVVIVSAVPPMRTTDRPGLDAAASALQVVLPAACGFLVAGRGIGDLPWTVLVAFTIWAMATHALGGIPDEEAARTRGVASIATTLGARGTAVFAAAGYLLAAVMVATLGSVGVLAAIGLAVYAQLPIMVIVAARSDVTAGTAAARRAWSWVVALDVLVGGWLSLLWLRPWESVPSSMYTLGTWASSAVLVVALLDIVLTRLATRRRTPRGRRSSAADIPSVTIVVAVQNDAATLGDSLDSLLQQTYADSSILVVDVGSTDDSVAVAGQMLGRYDKILSAPSVPDGWDARTWGSQVGADAATTDLILFADARTRLVPVAVRILVEQAQLGRYDLLSGVPAYEMQTRGERATVPAFPLLLFAFVPVWLSAIAAGRPALAAFAYGGLTLVDRHAYVAAGGHGATPRSRHGAIGLATACRRAGHRIGTVHAADLGTRRHDDGLRGAFGSWRRSFVTNAGDSLIVAVATMVVELIAFVLPLVLPLMAIATGQDLRTIILSAVPFALLVAARLALTLTQRQPPSSVLWHPVTIVIALVGQLASVVEHVLRTRAAGTDRAEIDPASVPSGL